MRWSARKFRWVLLGGAMLLAGMLAGFFGLARYRAGKIWQRILARNGINLLHDSNGVTWSQSSGGRTVFTLHASKVTPNGKDKWVAHDAVLILYGHQPGREDRIYGKQFEYDASEGVARAVGEVHMDLQAPEPASKAGTGAPRPELSFGPEDEAAADPGVIHVRTSGLVYLRKLGIAATGEAAEFRYGGITCVSRGAEFDTGPSVVRLLADVRLSGTLRKAPFTLTAAHAELDRSADTTDLTGAVLITGDRSARAGRALLHLHKDGTLAAGDASGGVEMRASTQTIAAPQIAVAFAADNHPQHARWFTGVRFAETDRGRPAEASANTLDLLWGASGALISTTADGTVRYAAHGTAKDGALVSREVRAEHIVASFAPDAGIDGRKALLRQVHLTGGAEVHTSANSAGAMGRRTATDVSGDDLTAALQPGSDGTPQVRQLHGAGHTRLEQISADGARQQSKGEALDVTFAPGTGDKDRETQVMSAVQTGQVEVQQWAAAKAERKPQDGGSAAGERTTARAGRAVFSQTDGTLTLEGSPRDGATVEQSGAVLAGARITLHQGSGDAEAIGGVTVTDWAQPITHDGDRTPTLATHVLASRARLMHAAGISEFFGEPRHPAQLWQGGSQVKADEITLDSKTRAVTATPGGTGLPVEAVFAAGSSRAENNGSAHRAGSQPEAARSGRGDESPEQGVPEAGRSAIRVSAGRMDYDDAHHEAVFTGAVRMLGVMGEASAERGNAFLRAPAPVGSGSQVSGSTPGLSGSLDRIVLLGYVRLTEPGRTGVGEQLTYTAATDTFVLTGTAARPPRVTGEQGSTVTGATLLFRSGESTIVVAGAKGNPRTTGPARVHTETDLKQ